MALDLEYWSLDDAKRLANFYNGQIAELPYAHAVSEADFDWGIRHPRYEENPHRDLDDEEVIVAKQDGQIVGFIHLADEKESHDDRQTPNGIIRFLSYMPGCRDVGQKLFDVAETRFREHGFSRIYAFLKNYIYRFYVLGYGVCDRQGHLIGLLGMNGYEVYKGEIFMDWPNFEVREPVLPDSGVEMRVKEIEGRGERPNLEVRAFRNGESFGACDTISLAHRVQANAFQDTFFVRWLGIQDAQQHHGWGRYMLLRAHWENQKLGYSHASISTSTRNHRALLFYTNYGYRVRDTWYEYVKVLSA